MKEIKEDTKNGKIDYAFELRNQYCQNDFITQGKLQVQFKNEQVFHGIFHNTRTLKKTKTKTKTKTPLVWKLKGSEIAKTILKKKSEPGRIRLLDFRHMTKLQ